MAYIPIHICIDCQKNKNNGKSIKMKLFVYLLLFTVFFFVQCPVIDAFEQVTHFDGFAISVRQLLSF